MRVSADMAVEVARQAIAEPYRQTRVMDTIQMASWLGGHDIKLRWQTLYALALKGVVRPVALTARPAGPPEDDRYITAEGLGEQIVLDLGRPTREEDLTGLSLGFELPRAEGHALLWHPFQLFEFEQLAARLEVPVAPEAVLGDAAGYAQLVSREAQRIPAAVATFAESDGHRQFTQVLAVLLAVEPLVILSLSTQLRIAGWPKSETVEGYWTWRSQADPEAVLRSAGLSIEDLRGWHRRLAFRGFRGDPLERWRHLVRLAPRDKRLKLKDRALLAEDLYYAAEVLRRYLEQFHAVDDLEEEDDVMHGLQGPAVKERFYGSKRTADFDRRVMRQIVREFDLDPQPRMRWFVEGVTEVAFIEEYTKLIHGDLDQAGVEVINLEGLGGLEGVRTRAFLTISALEEVFAHISIDRDYMPKNPRILETYEKNGLLPAGHTIFDPEFERANFTLAELAKVANGIAAEARLVTHLTGRSLGAEIKSRGGSARKAVVRLWWREMFPAPSMEKWGRALARHAYDHDPPLQVADDHQQRSAVSLLDYLRRAQTSSYRWTLMRSDVDEDGVARTRER